MSAIKDGGPAFPTDGRIQHGTAYDGMSLRDWFAGQALAGEFAAQNEHCGSFGTNSNPCELEGRARLMYRMADAMLAAREEKP